MKITLNSKISPDVKFPALSPDNFVYLNEISCSYFQYYTIQGKDRKWHGMLKNTGLNSLPLATVVLPVDINEYLSLSSRDVLSLSQGDVSPARIVAFKVEESDPKNLQQYPRLIEGAEMQRGVKFQYTGKLLVVEEVSPALAFMHEKTQTQKVTQEGTYEPLEEKKTASIAQSQNQRQLK